MTISKRAWKRSSCVIQQIKTHPFNLELARGSLSRNRFAYYIEQDMHYLKHFSKCHAIIAAKAPASYKHTFFHYADEEFLNEQAQVHAFFQKHFNLRKTKQMTPAMVGYTNYLLRTVSYEPFEVAIAAAAPCFWIYKEVGLSIAQVAKSNNPYTRWIETYSGPEFDRSTNEITSILDEVSQRTTKDVQEKMLNAFYISSKWEWHFLNDAYQQRVFDRYQFSNWSLNPPLP